MTMLNGLPKSERQTLRDQQQIIMDAALESGLPQILEVVSIPSIKKILNNVSNLSKKRPRVVVVIDNDVNEESTTTNGIHASTKVTAGATLRGETKISERVSAKNQRGKDQKQFLLDQLEKSLLKKKQTSEMKLQQLSNLKMSSTSGEEECEDVEYSIHRSTNRVTTLNVRTYQIERHANHNRMKDLQQKLVDNYHKRMSSKKKKKQQSKKQGRRVSRQQQLLDSRQDDNEGRIYRHDANSNQKSTARGYTLNRRTYQISHTGRSVRQTVRDQQQLLLVDHKKTMNNKRLRIQ